MRGQRPVHQTSEDAMPCWLLLALQRLLIPELLLHTQLTLPTSSVHMQINQSQIPTTQTALLSPNTKLFCSGPLLSCLTHSYTFEPLQSFRIDSPVLSLTVKPQQSPHQPPESLVSWLPLVLPNFTVGKCKQPIVFLMAITSPSVGLQ